MSCFSRMRARNRRADLESSTIKARLCAMRESLTCTLRSVQRNLPARASSGTTHAGRGSQEPHRDDDGKMTGWLQKAFFGAALASLGAGSSAMAVDRLLLSVGRLASPAATVAGARVSLQLRKGARLDAQIERLEIRRPGIPEIDDLRLTCGTLDLGSRGFACQAGRLAARAGALGPVSAAVSVDFDPRSGTWKIGRA